MTTSTSNGDSLTAIVLIPIDQLVPHPKNRTFFQPLSGDDWQLFLDDIAERGVVEPLLVTAQAQDLYRIISGENRYHAALELEISDLPCVIRAYANEEEELDDLIRCNVHRRQLDAFTKVRLASELVTRTRSRQGQRTDLTSVQNAQKLTPKKNEPPRDRIARELAMNVRDISAARLFAGLPDDAKALIAKWAEANDPNKKQLRERIKEVSAELDQVKRRERRLRRRTKELETLEKKKEQIEADEQKLKMWREISNQDARLAADAQRVQNTITEMRDWFKTQVSEIAYHTIDPEAIALVEPQIGDMVRMIDDIRALIVERYIERLHRYRKEQMDDSPKLFDGEKEER